MMGVHGLGTPADLARHLERVLPQVPGSWIRVIVIPRNTAEKKCALWEADHYEVRVMYTQMNEKLLEPLEKALQERPEVFLTTQVVPFHSGSRGERVRNMVTNKAWPPKLGTLRRDFHALRPQVIALMTDQDDLKGRNK